MRSLRCRVALISWGATGRSFALRRLTSQDAHRRVPRSVVLARWTGSGSAAQPPASSARRGMLGKGISFASGLLRAASSSTRTASTNSVADSTVGDVAWDLCEHMDYYVQYNVPSSWRVTELLRENSIAIQCSPPPASPEHAESMAGTVHGISLNCFAYKQRVKQADSVKLLHLFLKRFNASVNNSLEVTAEGHPPPRSTEVKLPAKDSLSTATLSSHRGSDDRSGICETLAKQLNSAVAEVSFTPGPGLPLAHGLCRAFYNSNGRFHYVVVVAVPDEEYATSLDLIIHALASVVESRVEAAAKRT